MAERIDDTRRRVVPRWRSYRTSAALGELGAVREVARPGLDKLAPGELEELEREWKDNQTPLHAAGLVDAALAIGDLEVANEAATWIVKNGGVSDVSIELAKRILRFDTTEQPAREVNVSANQRYAAIARYRRQLRQRSWDAILWIDLAREYSSIGQLPHARRAIRIALNLAPDNRFVLRSASRFFLHCQDPEQAHHVLLRAPSVSTDPWLLSAEIVASEANNQQSQHLRGGLRLLDSGHFKPRQISELASALGTLELKEGRRAKVRKLFARALVDPTENSVAQAAWVGRHMSGFQLPETSLVVPRAFEARAWDATVEKRFTDAIQLADDWFSDEPFATRPALFGSWIASMGLGDYGSAIRLVRAAMTANPDDPRLITQLLYCEACAGNLEVAEGLLPQLENAARRGDGGHTTREWEVLLSADRGLLAFRRGNPEAGRRFYEEAIELAAAHGLAEWGALALINYVREELLVSSRARVNVPDLRMATQVFQPAIRGVVEAFVDRLLVLATMKGVIVTEGAG